MHRVDRAVERPARPSPSPHARELGDETGKEFENAVARNHAPITVLTMRAGESLVTIESPTGERHSSPVVWSR